MFTSAQLTNPQNLTHCEEVIYRRLCSLGQMLRTFCLDGAKQMADRLAVENSIIVNHLCMVSSHLHLLWDFSTWVW